MNPQRLNAKSAKQTTPWSRIVAFGLAGLTGFVVDVSVLYLLIELVSFDAFSARIFSIAAALVATFLINRSMTFGASGDPIGIEFARYLSVAFVGAALNYVIYSGLLLAVSAMTPFLATLIAVIIVSVFSYAGYARFAFRK